MKKIIALIVFLSFCGTSYGYLGDSLGSHKAKKTINMNSNGINNLADPVNPQDADTKGSRETAVALATASVHLWDRAMPNEQLTFYPINSEPLGDLTTYYADSVWSSTRTMSWALAPVTVPTIIRQGSMTFYHFVGQAAVSEPNTYTYTLKKNNGTVIGSVSGTASPEERQDLNTGIPIYLDYTLSVGEYLVLYFEWTGVEGCTLYWGDPDENDSYSYAITVLASGTTDAVTPSTYADRVDMNTQRITHLGNPTETTDADTKYSRDLAINTSENELRVWVDAGYAQRTSTDSCLPLHGTADDSAKLNGQVPSYYSTVNSTNALGVEKANRSDVQFSTTSLENLKMDKTGGTFTGPVVLTSMTASAAYFTDVYTSSIQYQTGVSTEIHTDYIGAQTGSVIEMLDDINLFGETIYGGKVYDEDIQFSTTNHGQRIAELEKVRYSTGSIYASFIATSTANLMDMTTVEVRIPYDAIMKSWNLVACSTETATVMVSTGQVTGTGLTFGTPFITMSLSNTQVATGALSGTIPAGYHFRFVIATVAGCSRLYSYINYWRN